MNRIILIGNGFDLAHGLDTSYKHFIDDYWKNIIEVYNSKTTDGVQAQFEYNGVVIKYGSHKIDNELTYNQLKEHCKRFGYKLIINNKFLEIISDKHIENWVDIEDEYYRILKEIAKNKSNDYIDISDLNRDFEKIKKLLITYLSNIKDFETILSINNFIHSRFIGNNLNQNGLKTLTELYIKRLEKKGKEDLDYETTKQYLSKDIAEYDYHPNNILFVNFNYTNTDFLYHGNRNRRNLGSGDSARTIDNVYIHGNINKIDVNPIIFGYGDELDDDYKTIEKLNDNRYLEHIKSIEYLKTDNYKKLISFIESEKYQVFIMGHSCGLSDRTLLNTLFEHNNCVSIKPFFHKKEDGSDNYIELVQNISRNFNDKVKMRDRVVNKTYCEALPQYK